MQVECKRTFIGRLRTDADLLDSLTGLCRKENVTMGTFSVIGAVKHAKLGYYDQRAKVYTPCLEIDKKLEIASCIGNISLLDDEIFVHAHITLAGHDGETFGGHLMPGTSIFAAEYTMRELVGDQLKRRNDQETGLCLWPYDKES